MRKIIYFLLLIVFLGFFFYFQDSNRQVIKIDDYQINQMDFNGGKDYQFQYQSKPFVIISSHHLFSKYLINSTFKAVPFQPEKIIILGPNHFNSGSGNIILSNADFLINNQKVKVDNKSVKKIIKQVGVINNPVFEKEHSIYSLLPFIENYFPKTKVISIILKYQTNQQQIEELSNELKKIIDDKTLIIISADFCHDMLPVKESEIDKKSIEILTKLEENKIDSMVVDSRPAFKVLFNLLNYKQINKFQLLENTNSGILGGNLNLKNATSYIFGAYLY